MLVVGVLVWLDVTDVEVVLDVVAVDVSVVLVVVTGSVVEPSSSVVVAAAVVVATSPQHLMDATSSSSPLHTILEGSICVARDGTDKWPPSHSLAAHITCGSRLQPVPCTTSSAISFNVQSRAPSFVHTCNALL